MPCTEPLPNDRSPDDRAAAVVADRGGENLAGRGAVAIDQHHQRHPPRAGPVGTVVEVLALAPAAGARRYFPGRNELVRQLDRSTSAPRPGCRGGQAPGTASPCGAGPTDPLRGRGWWSSERPECGCTPRRSPDRGSYVPSDARHVDVLATDPSCSRVHARRRRLKLDRHSPRGGRRRWCPARGHQDDGHHREAALLAGQQPGRLVSRQAIGRLTPIDRGDAIAGACMPDPFGGAVRG